MGRISSLPERTASALAMQTPTEPAESVVVITIPLEVEEESVKVWAPPARPKRVLGWSLALGLWFAEPQRSSPSLKSRLMRMIVRFRKNRKIKKMVERLNHQIKNCSQTLRPYFFFFKPLSHFLSVDDTNSRKPHTQKNKQNLISAGKHYSKQHWKIKHLNIRTHTFYHISSLQNNI